MIALVWLVGGAFAYETDQLVDRDHPLTDAAPLADLWMDDFIAVAVDETNTALQCTADRQRTQEFLARQIERHAGQVVLVHDRGITRAFGHGRYELLLEQGPVDRINYDTPGVFSDVRFIDSPIIALAGVSSTIQVAGVRIGTDKIGHFIVDGYLGWRAERNGDAFGAEQFSTWTERTTLGWWTSDAFSYADIAANLSGARFYDGLLDDGSVVRLGGDGCVEVAHPWSWAAHVDGAWDEVLNPSVYRPAVQRAIGAFLDEHHREICDGYDQWADDAYVAERARRIADRPSYTTVKAITGPDPFDLALRCGDVRDGPVAGS